MPFFFHFFLFFLGVSSLSAQFLQHIDNLKENDPVYQQLMQDIMENYKRTAVGKTLLPLNLFTYRTQKHDTLYTLSLIHI